MSRHGRCRCGAVLRIRQGPHGYKTRCPTCGAVVRLRVEEGATVEPSPALGPSLKPKAEGDIVVVEMERWRGRGTQAGGRWHLWMLIAPLILVVALALMVLIWFWID